MDTEKLLNELTPDMVSPKWRLFVKKAGIESYHILTVTNGGQKIRIPKEGTILKGLIRQKVIDDYKGGNYSHQALAEKYQLSVKTVRKYLQTANAKKPT